MQFNTDAFGSGEAIPTRYTCDGADASPPLAIDDVPVDAEALAVVVADPDAPGGRFVHWLLWNVPPGVGEIPENVPPTNTVDDLDGARQGVNGFGEVGYRGPCPAAGDPPHTYEFALSALDRELDVDAGAKAAAVTDAIDDVRLASAEFTGTFGR